jgi:chromosome segregation ATPase
MVLCDQEKELREQLREKKESLKKVRPPTAKMSKDKNQIKLLENRCEQALTKFNELQSQNKSLRKQIDTWREQLRNQGRVNKVYNKEIGKHVDEIKKINGFTYNGQRFCQDTNDQILALKAKHDIDKFTFEHKILDLQEKLKERDDSELEQTKTKGIEVKDSSSTQEFANPVALMKPRLQRW